MATLTVRGLDEETRTRLRIRAAEHGRSMEAEVRAILHLQLYPAPPPSAGGLGSRIHARFAGIDSDDLELPTREEAPRSAEFDE
jgi:plasmid stability protein